MRATHVFRLFSMDTEREYVYTILLYKVKIRLFHTLPLSFVFLHGYNACIEQQSSSEEVR